MIAPANWVHRVELLDKKRAWTLVFVGNKRRDWGFWTSGGWILWTEYFRRLGC